MLDTLICGAPSLVFEQPEEEMKSVHKSFIGQIMHCTINNEIIGSDNLVILESVAKLVYNVCVKMKESAVLIDEDSHLLLTAIMLLKCMTKKS